MSSPWVVGVTTVAIIALSAFFVAVEFAMLAARRHRFEDAAASSRTARAALRSSHELTVLLAGAQLGITACTLALGAITKPAVHHWITPLLASWGLPAVPADVAGFVLALAIVTFLHLVVGEMAPKSWAIAHPESSAQLLALPMRAFMWAARPVLRALNESANHMLRRVGVEPVDEMSAGTDPASLRHLVEHSANVGALDAAFSDQLSQALELQRMTVADLKSDKGQAALHRELAKADVLITSFRPSALVKLGLAWKALRARHPQLSQVAIVGSPGERAEEPGHDLTYLAENGLVTGLDLPATLYADMGGSLMASEAVLQAVLHQRAKGKGVYLEVALSAAAGYLALPRSWGLTQAGAAVGGGHAGYRLYACKDGRVALAALEPHFAASLCAAAGIEAPNMKAMFAPATHAGIEAWLKGRTRKELDTLAVEKDIPLHTLV